METFGYPISDRAREIHERISDFMDRHIIPAQDTYLKQLNEGDTRWKVIPVVEDLKKIAKEEGLWNFFLPESDFGGGLTNVEYAPLGEIMGQVGFASECFNCSAPDTGNMEVLERYGSEMQKEKWLKPLLAGEIRSAFAMTEPAVASSDASNISLSAVREGDEYVLNGEKWWTSGAGDPRCKVLITMCVTNPDESKYRRQSQILVPFDSEGLEVLKMLHVFGYDDAPHGHAHIRFTNVRVPASYLILGEGRGFEIAQGRLGPGRIHHCMRSIGVAERALEAMCRRAVSREAFGKRIAELGANYDYIAEARIEIDQARMLTMQAAHAMDTLGNKEARIEIAKAKVAIPNMTLKVVDRAIQIHGAGGVSQVTPLASLYAHQRTLRLADGPDEVHRRVIARTELAKYDNQ